MLRWLQSSSKMHNIKFGNEDHQFTVRVVVCTAVATILPYYSPRTSTTDLHYWSWLRKDDVS